MHHVFDVPSVTIGNNFIVLIIHKSSEFIWSGDGTVDNLSMKGKGQNIIVTILPPNTGINPRPSGGPGFPRPAGGGGGV